MAAEIRRGLSPASNPAPPTTPFQLRTFTFAAADCESRPGNRITCTEFDSRGNPSDRIRIKPRGRLNDFRADLLLNSLDIDFLVRGPITLDMELRGRSSGGDVLICRGSTPPATRSTCTP